MEGYFPVNTQEQRKSSSLARNMLALIGEILVLVSVFCVLLAALNYMHVLSLARAFPFLAFLPQKQQAIQMQTFTSPSPPYHYNTAAVNSVLEAFATATLQSVYLPGSLAVSLTPNTAAQSVTSVLFDSWQQKGYTFGIQASYQKNTTILQQLTLSAQLPSQLIPPSPLTAIKSSALLNTFFLHVPSPVAFTCKEKQSVRTQVIDFCQSFSATSSGKAGYGVVIYRSSPPLGQLFFCTIPKSNPLYDQFNTCIAF